MRRGKANQVEEQKRFQGETDKRSVGYVKWEAVIDVRNRGAEQAVLHQCTLIEAIQKHFHPSPWIAFNWQQRCRRAANTKGMTRNEAMEDLTTKIDQ